MAKLESKTKENPKLCQRTLEDGRISLYLEFYYGRKQWIDPETEKVKVKHFRKKYNLKMYLLPNPKTPIDRNFNREILEVAKKARFEAEQQMKERSTGYRLPKPKPTNFIEYFQQYIDGYTKKDKRVLVAVLKDFSSFILEETPEYKDILKPVFIDTGFITKFVDFLQSKHEGETPKTYYARFKKVVNQACKEGIFKSNPCEGVRCDVDSQILRKDILSAEEVRKLIDTHYLGENPEIQRAFKFSLFTGLRFVDIKELRFKNIDYSNKKLSFEQSKTTGKSKASGVVIPLNDILLSLVGKPPLDTEGEPMFGARIFTLPSHTMCLKALRHWTKRAGISKHITWHCGRHSFAVNILNKGANIKTVASLLGHAGLKHTEKYTRAVDELKEKAINSLFD